MKTIIQALFVLLLSSAFAVQAQTYDINNLSPEVNTIIQNARTECQMNDDQEKKFKVDYIWFLNENARIANTFAGNQVKINLENQKILFQAGAKFRAYLNNDQFAKLRQMIQEGRLNPANAKATLPAPDTAVKPALTPTPTTGSKPDNQPQKPVNGNGTQPAANKTLVASNVTALFEQLTPHLNTTPDQVAKTKPILQDYDKKVMDIKNRNKGNDAQIASDIAALNQATVPLLKQNLRDDQLTKLVVAVKMQEDVLSGKNLTADQKVFMDKLRQQYQLNDVQLMSVILVMVQAKVRGDAINALAKTNQQAATQELGKLMQDLDGQLKSSLNTNQYNSIKADIEKLLKGQKL